MKVYLVIAVSSGEVPIEIDHTKAFLKKEDALADLKNVHDEWLEEVSAYDPDDEWYGDSYSIAISDEDGMPGLYEGQVREVEVI